MVELIRSFLTLLLVIYHPPADTALCIESRREQIVTDASMAVQMYDVPPLLLLSIAFLETHIGCDHGEGGGWGAPISRTRRHTAGRASHAARALRHSYEVCGSWFGATNRFRCGLCNCRRLVGYTPRQVWRFMSRFEDKLGQPPLPSL